MLTHKMTYSTKSILYFVSLYVLLLAVGRILHIDLSVLTYALALMMISLNVFLVLQNLQYFERYTLFLFVMLLVLSLINMALNQSGVSELIKIIGSQLFFFIGAVHALTYQTKSLRITISYKFLTLILLIVPVFVLLLQMMDIIHEKELYRLSSIFINKNNAVVYFLTLAPLLYLLDYSKKMILLYLILTVLLFQTLGAILAVFIAFILVYFKLSPKTIFYGILGLIFALALFQIGTAFEIPSIIRISNLLVATNKLLTYYTFNEIGQMSFGKMVSITGSQDLSFFFRIKHWSDIVSCYMNAPFYNQIFGIGLERIQEITQLKLVAHNDWLKMTVEMGILYPIIYAFFVFISIKNLAKNDPFLSVIFLTVLIYFFSENLINNFLAMSLFYYFFGYYTTKSLESSKHENTTHQ